MFDHCRAVVESGQVVGENAIGQLALAFQILEQPRNDALEEAQVARLFFREFLVAAPLPGQKQNVPPAGVLQRHCQNGSQRNCLDERVRAPNRLPFRVGHQKRLGDLRGHGPERVFASVIGEIEDADGFGRTRRQVSAILCGVQFDVFRLERRGGIIQQRLELTIARGMLRKRKVPDGLQPMVMRAETWGRYLVHTARPVVLQRQSDSLSKIRGTWARNCLLDPHFPVVQMAQFLLESKGPISTVASCAVSKSLSGTAKTYPALLPTIRVRPTIMGDPTRKTSGNCLEPMTAPVVALKAHST